MGNITRSEFARRAIMEAPVYNRAKAGNTDGIWEKARDKKQLDLLTEWVNGGRIEYTNDDPESSDALWRKTLKFRETIKTAPKGVRNEYPNFTAWCTYRLCEPAVRPRTKMEPSYS